MWQSICTIAPIVYKVTVSLLFIGILSYVIEILSNVPKMYKSYMQMKIYDVHIKAEKDASSLNILDSFISNTFSTYITMNMYAVTKDIYQPLTKDEQDKITKEVVKTVMEDMSVTLKDRLFIYYDSIEVINKIIFNKVYMLTVALAVERNGVKGDDSKK